MSSTKILIRNSRTLKTPPTIGIVLKQAMYCLEHYMNHLLSVHYISQHACAIWWVMESREYCWGILLLFIVCIYNVGLVTIHKFPCQIGPGSHTLTAAMQVFTCQSSYFLCHALPAHGPWWARVSEHVGRDMPHQFLHTIGTTSH